jgi:hypothetical protein
VLAIVQAYFNIGAIMAINLIKPTLTLIVEYTSGSEYVKFFEGGVVRTFLSDEFEELQQSQDFFDFVASVIKNYSSVTRNISYNVVDNWQELNECFDLFEDMTDNQKVLLDHVLCDYSYSYDLTTLTNYCLENACLFEGKASDYAYELIADCYDTKRMGNLVHYIDYDSFAGDMLLNSEIIELEYNLYWTNPHDIY